MDLKELQKKLEKDGLRIHYDNNSQPYVSVPVGKVPLKQYEEWQNHVDANYNGNRWLAVWTQYIRSQNFDLQVEVEALRKEIHEDEEVETEDNNELGLLNGE